MVGGGAAGIAALGRLKANGFKNIKLLEKNSELGGVWSQTHYPGLNLQSKRFAYRFFDYEEMSACDSEEIDGHASGLEVLTYLSEYTQDKGLQRFIQFDTAVSRIVYDDSSRLQQAHEIQITSTESQKSTSIYAKKIVLALGFSVAGAKHIPNIPGLEGFTGQYCHCADFTTELFEHSLAQHQRVCLVGGGKSGHEIALRYAERQSTAELLWVYNKPLWGINYDFLYQGEPEEIRERLAHAGVILADYIEQYQQQNFSAAEQLAEQLIDMQYLINVDVNDKSIRHFRGAMYKPAELELLRNTVNQEKAQIIRVDGDTVTFSNGQSERFDVIVFCTGYNKTANLPEIVIKKGHQEVLYNPCDQAYLYNGMIDHVIPSIAFFTGSQLFYQQLFTYSVAAEWLARFYQDKLKVTLDKTVLKKVSYLQWDRFSGIGRWVDPKNQGESGGSSYLTEGIIPYFDNILQEIGLSNKVIDQYGYAMTDHAFFVELVNEMNRVLSEINKSDHSPLLSLTKERSRFLVQERESTPETTQSAFVNSFERM